MSSARDAWREEAVRATERSIDALLQNFLRQPFAHRVEHSLHVDLYDLMRREPSLSGEVEIGRSGYVTRLVHKEWPSLTPTTLRKGRLRRQSYDLAVVDRYEIESGNPERFVAGRFTAAVAVELGLDYGIKHLQGDLTKIEVNDLAHGYVVHFSRKRTRTVREIEDALLSADQVKAAYAHIDWQARTVRWKGLEDDEVHVEAIPNGGSNPGRSLGDPS